MSVESCSPSMTCDMGEVCSKLSRKMQDKEETASEASWTAVTKGGEKEVWRLEPEGEAEKLGAIGLWNEAESVSVNPEGESRHRHARAKNWQGRKERIKTRMEKEVKGKGTWGRGCGGSKSEKKSDSSGI